MDKLVNRVWRQMVVAVTESRDGWRRQVAEATGLPFSRVRALRRLENGPKTLGQIAEEMSTDASAATIAINDLEKKGLVAREVHASDRRARSVSLTAAGKKVVAKARAISDEAPPSFAALPEKELEKLEKTLEALGFKG